MLKRIILSCLTAVLLTSTVSAQTTGLTVIHDSIYTKILKETRTLEVVLKQSQQKMELAWVLPDGVEMDENPRAIPWAALYAPKE